MLGAVALCAGALLAAPAGRRPLALVVALAAGALAQGSRLEGAARTPSARVERTVEGTVEAVNAGAWGWTVDLGDVAAASGPAPALPPRLRVAGEPTSGSVATLADSLPGERVRARVRLRAASPPRNPGERDAARALARAGIGARARLVHPALHARIPEREGWRPLAGIHRARATVGRRLSRRGRGGPLLRALAVGDRRDLGEASREAFASLGIAHLLAVSGLHLALVGAVVFALVRAALGRTAAFAARWDARSGALGAAVLAATGYALVAGWGVPVRRAWIALAAVLLASARGRPRVRAEPLAAAALVVLCCEPDALFRAGAQLSFAASAALVFALRRGDGLSPSRAAEGVRVSATAIAATAPLAAWHFGAAAPLGLVANAIAVPWTACVLLPGALAAAGAAWLPSGAPGDLLMTVAERVAGLTLSAVEAAAAVSPGVHGGPRPHAGWIALASALALAVLAAQRTRARCVLAVAVGGVLALATPAEVPPAPPRVVALAVGQGDATLVQGRTARVLVDAATAIPGGVDTGRSVVVPALRALGVEALDLLVLTHGDLDHRGGAPAVLDALPLGAIWLPLGAGPDPAFDPVRAAARARGVPVRERGAGSPPLQLGDLSLQALWPPRGVGQLSDNDRSLVLRIRVGAHRVLLPGDLQATGEAALLASGADLRADLLALPHHGSATSSTPAFLAAVGAHVAWASAACAGRFGLPAPEVVRRVRDAGAPVWWTGRDGAVLAGLGDVLHVHAHRSSPESCR